MQMAQARRLSYQSYWLPRTHWILAARLNVVRAPDPFNGSY